jgi:hypothetical protein
LSGAIANHDDFDFTYARIGPYIICAYALVFLPLRL